MLETRKERQITDFQSARKSDDSKLEQLEQKASTMNTTRTELVTELNQHVQLF